MEYYTQEWREEALCRQTDAEVFFPEAGGSAKPAKAICGRCPVREDCLAWALHVRLRVGIAGGLSPRERAAILKERDADAA